MNLSEHLTENQLADYFGSHALDREAKHLIGRHLLQCDSCLKRLPQPTVEQFWTALMTDEFAEVPTCEETTLAERLNYILQSLKHPRVFALSAAALAVLIFFSGFIWLGAAKSSETESEVAQNFEPAKSKFNQNGDEPGSSLSVSPASESNNLSSSPPAATPRDVAKPASSKIGDTAKNSPKTASPTNFNPKTLLKSAEQTKISSTRGGSAVFPNCASAGAIEMTSGSNGESITLRWKKIPKAAKYHLYVSDDDEILVDEFETGKEISYVLKIPLDPLKTYQWKVVVTLEDGSTVIGDSQKFVINSLKLNQKKSDSQKSGIVRCSESKFNR